MNIHYFQRYHDKENMVTANTMLLLSRLYSYSPDLFFRFLKNYILSDGFEPEINFTLQKKSVNSIPDAVISQKSFSIAVETKMSDRFNVDQLKRHLNSFGDEDCKVLLTLAPKPMHKKDAAEFELLLKSHNEKTDNPVLHVNTTFEELIKDVDSILDDRDYEMQEVLDDYRDFCYTGKLIPNEDGWKYMRVPLCTTTFDFNTSNNVYFCSENTNFRAHDIIGLYNKKSVRAIGKIVSRAVVEMLPNGPKIEPEFGNLTEKEKSIIAKAMILFPNLREGRHRFFFVEHFYDTDFRKTSPRAPMGTRMFNLTELMGTDKLPDLEILAEQLKTKTWV